jgi:hypothetical protein
LGWKAGVGWRVGWTVLRAAPRGAVGSAELWGGRDDIRGLRVVFVWPGIRASVWVGTERPFGWAHTPGAPGVGGARGAALIALGEGGGGGRVVRCREPAEGCGSPWWAALRCSPLGRVEQCIER